MRDRYGDPIEDEPVDAFAVAHCEFCDDTGMRGLHRCSHLDHSEAAKRGMAMIREAMGWK